MTIPKTKLRPPILRQPIVPRPRLTQSFTDRRPLTIVSAPAGSGKTTLALEWLASNKANVAWLSLDSDDNDPIRFINGFIAALQTTGLKLRAPSGQRDIKTIITEIINQFENRDRVTLVLDDYHLITETSIHSTLEYLLDHIPATLQLVLITRETPPLPLARLRARDQLREFHLSELRFTAEETAQFLNQIMGLNLSAQQVQSISQHTQGWVAGLQMAGLSLQSNLAQSIPNESERQFITDYFLTEVFNHQPKEVQSFLLNTSVLEKFSAAQCKSIYSGNASKMLAHLEKANLFITAVDQWYQYHPLFREFLQAKLQSTFPERAKDLHKKSQRWLEENEFLAEAIPHAFVIADDESAARLIATLAPDTLKRGELVILRRWLDRLPESIIWRYPRLCLTQIWLLLDSNLQNEAQTYLDRLGNYLEKNLKSEFLILRALHAAMTHQPELAMKYVTQAQKTKAAKDPFLQTYVSFGLGAAQKMALHLFDAEQSFKNSLALADSEGNSFIALSAYANLTDALYLQARLADSEKACREALERFQENLPEASDWYWTLSRIHYQRNQLETALDLVNRSIDLCPETVQSTLHTRALLQRAQIYYGLGDKEKAQADLDTAERLARKLQDINILRSLLRQRVILAIRDGNLESARQWFATLAPYGEAPYAYYHTYTKARLLLAERKFQEAEAEFETTLNLLEGLELALIRIETLIWYSVCLNELNQTSKATKLLNEGLKLAKQGNVVRPLVEARVGLMPIVKESSQRLEHAGVAWALEQANRISRQVADGERGGSSNPVLTRREKEILRLLANGLSNQEMAEQLVIAEGTLKRHVANLYQKLGVHNRAQAIQYLNK
jgi:LuxR family transcriptional regulator, maltose regulon positive regulatory protein